MNFKQRLEKAGATPAKLALIGVLSLVLVGVVAVQLPDATESTVAATPSGSSTQLTKTDEINETDGATSNQEDQQRQIPPWPESDLVATLANNPFAQPSWAVVGAGVDESVALAAADVAGELSDLQEQGASIVVIGTGRKLATIGDQRLYVGDILEGYRVTDITTQGILLDKIAE